MYLGGVVRCLCNVYIHSGVFLFDIEWFDNLCQERKWGIQVEPGKYLGILMFADNFWLFARSPAMLQDMYNAWIASESHVSQLVRCCR